MCAGIGCNTGNHYTAASKGSLFARIQLKTRLHADKYVSRVNLYRKCSKHLKYKQQKRHQ